MPINFYLRALCFFLPYLLNRLFLFLQHFRPQETQLSNFRRIEVLRPFAMVCPKSYIYDYYLFQVCHFHCLPFRDSAETLELGSIPKKYVEGKKRK